MRQRILALTLMILIGAPLATLTMYDIAAASQGGVHDDHDRQKKSDESIQLGPRPFFLVNDMTNGPLKNRLQSCSDGPFKKTDFSIGHRGAALQFPEHTRESFEAGARMGAGILECDVTFTKDKELVCRHGQNDLHTTTNILVTPLASKCVGPFTPAVFGPNGVLITPATAECRTSDLTLAEFKSLTGKMDSSDPRAKTPEEFQGGVAGFRTNFQAGPTSGHLLTHRESIELFKRLGVKMTPEAKTPVVPMPFDGFTQEMFLQKIIDDYKAAGVRPGRVFPQSFNKSDVLYWINNEPAFGKQAVFLDDAETPADLPTLADLVDYYQTFHSAIERDGDVMKVLDVLARRVGIRGIFSDWAATVTYYANCVGLN